MNRIIPETSRIEIKFVASDIYYYALLNWLHLHSAGFTSPYPDRWVNNIYFDTHDLAAYAQNLSGVSSRTKVRYRWYGESVCPSAGILEVKQRRNLFGWKFRFKINRSPYIEGSSWRTIRGLLLDQLPPEGKRWLDANPVPVLINHYFRKYFISVENDVRVTVDSRQKVMEQRFKAYPNFTHSANIPEILVVEFKFDRKQYGNVSHIIQGIPIRRGRHSKYITGVKAISGI
jgi:hypothetical protein